MTTYNSDIQYSIVIPHLSNSKCIDLCLKYLAQNSYYKHEIVEILDETDVYYAFNKGVYQAKSDTVVLLSDDMMVAKDWDKFIPIYSDQKTILTGYVVEPNPGKLSNDFENIRHDCGYHYNFDYEKFQNFVNEQSVPEFKQNEKGWYQPLVVNQRSFVTYPNIQKFPYHPNDIVLVEELMPAAGFNFARIDMFVYHFQRQSGAYGQRDLPKRCIFSCSNPQVDRKIATLQNKVLEKINKIPNCKIETLFYADTTDKLYHDKVLDYAFEKLFYEFNYDTVLLLDIDCIPLNLDALEYMFERAEKDILVGNVQRANHIQNNKHVYVAPSAMGISKSLFEKMGKPSFGYSNRGDVGEELTYIAEKMNIPIEYCMPSKYEALPLDTGKPWPLADNMPEYGIGTTFINQYGKEMFYHLFQSRFGKFNDLFFVKCAELLLKN
jgi:hypothetical protein